MKKLLSILLIAILFSSCSEYQTALKSDDMALKYAAAEKKYEKAKYKKALRLFEQMGPGYKGKPQADKMYYMFAQSYYKTEQYYLAGYQFESFVASYPKSEKVEEAAFLGAKSYSELSPAYSLDQVDTEKAIDKLQTFIDRYPESQYLAEANATVKVLREKLEKKAFEIARNYNTIGEFTRDYGAAIKALDNFIADYPGTPFKEKALYYKFDSSYELAINSIPAKKEQRLHDAKMAYAALMKFNAGTEYKQQADEKLAKIEDDLKQYSK